MKKYVKPIMQSEEFITSEYVAACWLVYCDGPRMSNPKIYDESNGVPGLQTSADGSTPADRLVRSYSFTTGGCGNYHGGVISDKEPAINGYWTGTTGWWPNTKTETYEVFWWNAAAANADDYHESLLTNKKPSSNPNAS